MKQVEDLKSLVDESIMVSHNKNILKGFLDRVEEDYNTSSLNNKLVSSLSTDSSFDIIIDTEEVKIYKIFSNRKDSEHWDVKYPYRFIWKDKDIWVRCHEVYPTLDTAYLGYVGVKNLGYDSRFLSFVTKMLGIELT